MQRQNIAQDYLWYASCIISMVFLICLLNDGQYR